MPVPFVLVTGFLGSGKTTLLKRFISQYADTQRLAIIQNEFAPSGVDGEDLRLTGKQFDILEINRGSVFCVCLLSDFVKSLEAMVDGVHPEVVLLEATGLADPIAVAQLLHAPELRERVFLRHVYCVVDAGSFLRIERAVTRVGHQVRIADTVLVNKTDTDGADLAAVERRVNELNPFAEIRRTAYCDTGLDILQATKTAATVAEKRQEELSHFESRGRPPMGSVAARRSQPVARNALERFLARNAPGSYRLKGFVNLAEGGTVAVQSCFGRTTIAPIERYNGASELVAMGPGVEPDEFVRLFQLL
jgi:G3E family GTPase